MRAIIIILFLCVSCNSSTNEHEVFVSPVDTSTADYIPLVDSLGFNQYLDTAKFYLYAYHCDVKFAYSGTKPDSGYFSYLSLSYDTLILKSDTVEMYFRFIANNEAVDPNKLKEFVYLKNGIAFNAKTGEKLYLTTDRNLIVKEVGKSSRFVNPLQPDVIRFLQVHKQRLDPWFRGQLEKYKIFSQPGASK